MRDAFTRALHRLAAHDPNLILITGDLGFGVLKPFWTDYPRQFINAGIAEQVKITGTPAFFLDGERIDFSGTKGEEGFLNVFREKIDEKLGK